MLDFLECEGKAGVLEVLEDLLEDGVVLSCLEGELVKKLTTGLWLRISVGLSWRSQKHCEVCVRILSKL